MQCLLIPVDWDFSTYGLAQLYVVTEDGVAVYLSLPMLRRIRSLERLSVGLRQPTILPRVRIAASRDASRLYIASGDTEVAVFTRTLERFAWKAAERHYDLAPDSGGLTFEEIRAFADGAARDRFIKNLVAQWPEALKEQKEARVARWREATESPFRIAGIEGIKEVYAPGEAMVLWIYADEPGFPIPSPSRGFEVFARGFERQRRPFDTSTYQSTYDEPAGAWKLVLSAPAEPAVSYALSVFLQCRDPRAACGTPPGTDQEKTLHFAVR